MWPDRCPTLICGPTAARPTNVATAFTRRAAEVPPKASGSAGPARSGERRLLHEVRAPHPMDSAASSDASGKRLLDAAAASTSAIKAPRGTYSTPRPSSMAPFLQQAEAAPKQPAAASAEGSLSSSSKSLTVDKTSGPWPSAGNLLALGKNPLMHLSRRYQVPVPSARRATVDVLVANLRARGQQGPTWQGIQREVGSNLQNDRKLREMIEQGLQVRWK